jgi:hypothetical protein
MKALPQVLASASIGGALLAFMASGNYTSVAF